MNPWQDAPALLDTLGRRYGIEGLAFDDRGLCALAFDRRLTVNLALDPRLGGWVMFAVLGEFAPLARPELLLAMLRGNFMWRVTHGATLAMDTARDAALLVQCPSRDGSTLESAAQALDAQLNTFVDTGLSWMERLTRPPEHSPPGLPAGGLPGMMLRV